MATLTELTAEIIKSHAIGTSVTSEELIHNIKLVFNTLKALEAGDTTPTAESPVAEVPAAPTITIKQAFKKDEVICMICNKGFKTLKRHLSMVHQLKPGEYRKQFSIPSTQSLAAKSYSDSRRQLALDKGLGEGLVKYRADKAAEKVAVPVEVVTPSPVVKKPTAKKATAPVKKVKVPAKVEKRATKAIAALKKMTNKD